MSRKKKDKKPKITFTVDPVNGIVVCSIRETKDDVADVIRSLENNGYIDLDLGYYYDRKISNRFVGVAKCSPEDEFNEDVGKLIAESKAKIKYYRAMEKGLESFYMDYLKKESRLDDAIENRLFKFREAKLEYLANVSQYNGLLEDVEVADLFKDIVEEDDDPTTVKVDDLPEPTEEADSYDDVDIERTSNDGQ